MPSLVVRHPEAQAALDLMALKDCGKCVVAQPLGQGGILEGCLKH